MRYPKLNIAVKNKLILFLLFISFSSVILSQDLDSAFIKIGNEYYFKITNTRNNKLVYFLHGGIKDNYFKEQKKSINLNYLIENNCHFISQMIKNGFDLIFPVTSDSLNWLNKTDYCFKIIKDISETENKNYRETYISGFSDGGTGSFKIFYKYYEYFNGLIVFNGFPQHNNFSNKIDYKKINNKKIIFIGTYRDKIIPYEFMIETYHHQKKYNSNTFLYVKNGSHNFEIFEKEDFNKISSILNSEIKNDKFIQTHGYIENDELIEFYMFRKKIVSKYNFGQNLLKINKEQKVNINKTKLGNKT